MSTDGELIELDDIAAHEGTGRETVKLETVADPYSVDWKIEHPPFSLESVLVLYYTSSKADTYVNWMDGFKRLVHWLRPIAIPEYRHRGQTPACFITYEQQEVAKIIGCSLDAVFWTLVDIVSKSGPIVCWCQADLERAKNCRRKECSWKRVNP